MVATVVIEGLLKLQDLDLRIRSIEKELKDIPARKKLEESRLDDHKKAVAAADENLKKRQAQLKELENEAESYREKIRKYRQQQTEIKTNNEFRAIETEIQAAQKQINGTEDRELDIMSDIEAARQEQGLHKESLKQEEAAVLKDVSVWEERIAELNRELEHFRAERQKVVAEIPDAAWLKQYEAVFTRKDRAVVPLEGGICGGCHLQLAPYVIHDVRKRMAIVTCSFCGRLLY